MADLTTEFAAYLVDLKAANATKTDSTTLVALDLPTVQADNPDVDDANTMYLTYLTA